MSDVKPMTDDELARLDEHLKDDSVMVNWTSSRKIRERLRLAETACTLVPNNDGVNVDLDIALTNWTRACLGKPLKSP